MQQYRVVNEQPIPEQLFFWKYSDYKTHSKSPIRKPKEQIKPTIQRQEEEALAECTFKPQQFSKRSIYFGESDFIQRCQYFEEQRQTKLQKQRMNEVENELKECTFQPKISQYVRNANTINLNDTSKKQIESQPMKQNQKQLYKYSDALNLLHKELHN